MEQKTKIAAEEGRQELVITREFELPVDLLFRAYEDAGIIEQWMGTRVLKLESRKHGSWQYETADEKGNILFRANGVIHEFLPNQKITRTFEMEHAPFGVQLEVCQFEPLSENSSRLTVHVIYESGEQRDQMLQLPFAQGINMAHNRLQTILSTLSATGQAKKNMP